MILSARKMNKTARTATTRHRNVQRVAATLVVTLSVLAVSLLFERRSQAQSDPHQRDLLRQSQADVDRKNFGGVRATPPPTSPRCIPPALSVSLVSIVTAAIPPQR